MSGGDLVFIGDVHLDREDPALGPFLAFLGRLEDNASRVVLAGDLFNLWVGRPEFEGPHHDAVVDRLRRMRRRGLVVRYLEGNRDYRIGPAHARGALDDVTDRGLVETFGGHRIFAVHGDLANPKDRKYRAWRRISRSTPFWVLFRLLPRGARVRVAEALEGRLRRTNLAYKRHFPEAEIRRYAEKFFRRGHDMVVLGHFHVEREIESTPPSPSGRIFVLPEWKGNRRHLVVSPTGEIRFVDSEV